jgi:hypothetical protein
MTRRNVSTFCPETCTFAKSLEQDDWWQVKNPLSMQIVARRFCQFSAHYV